MSTSRELARATAPLLAAMVVVQSVLAMLPHQHNPEARVGPAAVLEHVRSGPHHGLLPVCQRVPPPACLACAVTTPAFAQPGEGPTDNHISTAPVIAAQRADPPTLPLLWRHPHRGPPLRA